MSMILALQGYIVAIVALYVAFAPRRRKAHRAMRPALCLLSFVAAAVSTLTIARVGGPGAVHLISLAACSITAAASLAWLFVSVIGSFVPCRRETRDTSVDFSFLETAPQADSPQTESPAAPRPKLNHRRWIARLQKIKFLNRWSYMSDSP